METYKLAGILAAMIMIIVASAGFEIAMAEGYKKNMNGSVFSVEEQKAIEQSINSNSHDLVLPSTIRVTKEPGEISERGT
jgi:hypothetical protein